MAHVVIATAGIIVMATVAMAVVVMDNQAAIIGSWLCSVVLVFEEDDSYEAVRTKLKTRVEIFAL